MTKSSIIFYNVHIKNSSIQFQFTPEVENYRERFRIYTPWTYHEVNGHLEYDRKSTLYTEIFTLRKFKSEVITN